MVSIAEKIKLVEKAYLRKDLPQFAIGDTVKMMVKVTEGDKARRHPFEGIVIRKAGSGAKATFTVRKVAFGEGVERTFPIHSPVIESLKIVSRGDVKQAKLYYLRTRVGKRARVKKKQS